MRILLDTHVLLWFALSPGKLSSTAMNLLMDPAHDKLVSPASYWEIAIKISTGKFVLSVPFLDFLHRAVDQNGFQYLALEPRHAAALVTLPYHHRDPFDRLIMAQAMVENVPLLSSETLFDQYPIKRLW